jgi:hypothetical protein
MKNKANSSKRNATKRNMERMRKLQNSKPIRKGCLANASNPKASPKVVSDRLHRCKKVSAVWSHPNRKRKEAHHLLWESKLVCESLTLRMLDVRIVFLFCGVHACPEQKKTRPSGLAHGAVLCVRSPETRRPYGSLPVSWEGQTLRP